MPSFAGSGSRSSITSANTSRSPVVSKAGANVSVFRLISMRPVDPLRIRFQGAEHDHCLSLVGAKHLSDVLGMLQSVGVTRIFEDAPPDGAHEMGVGVDESREDGLASAINDLGGWETGTGGWGSGQGRRCVRHLLQGPHRTECPCWGWR